MRRFSGALVALTIAVQPAAADEFEAVVDEALQAYRDGELTIAREELTYALQLLTGMRAETLADFLPAPLDGWRRDDPDIQGTQAMAMFGGGTAASATYRRNGDEFTLTLTADSPMVSGMAAMFTGMAGMQGGRSVRIQRHQFSVGEGEVTGVVGGAVLVQAQGRVPTDAMVAHVEAMDLGALANY
jgi:hypothetical protein